jgi:hypothetical protein
MTEKDHGWIPAGCLQEGLTIHCFRDRSYMRRPCFTRRLKGDQVRTLGACPDLSRDSFLLGDERACRPHGGDDVQDPPSGRGCVLLVSDQ